ncbi:hypothetical protein Lalb_Chr01g0011581 [Lupinus albus]|uniref:Transmembrane protein n=1 Tax=Lupinus albus TaxID=3870 RepID=A0A6A4R689_LUPAL|nr:hypothetical protein Lalb_Chr01g0011581 [Lupinus albus]
MLELSNLLGVWSCRLDGWRVCYWCCGFYSFCWVGILCGELGDWRLLVTVVDGFVLLMCFGKVFFSFC